MEVEGININIVDKYGCTLLHVASLHGNIGVVNYLIEKGVTVDIKDSFSRTPLHLSAEGGCKDVVDFLIEKGAEDGSTPLYEAAFYGHINIVNTLIGKGETLI